MKYITLIIGLLAVGCGKQEQADTNDSTPTTNTNKVSGPRVQPDGDVDLPVRKLTAEEKKALMDSVVGEYEWKDKDGNTFKHVFLENGKVVHLNNGEKVDEGTWKIHRWINEGNVVGEEVIVESESEEFKGFGSVYEIEVNGDLTWIASIEDGKRKDFQKNQTTYKKIK